MKTGKYVIAASLLLTVSCSTTKEIATTSTMPAEKRVTEYVNPLIGSGGHGHVFVGASVPFGMVQLGPTSINQQWVHSSLLPHLAGARNGDRYIRLFPLASRPCGGTPL